MNLSVKGKFSCVLLFSMVLPLVILGKLTHFKK